MDIMREACEVPDFEEPMMAKGTKNGPLTFGDYFETKTDLSHLEKPKVRGVVVKVRVST